MSRQMVWSVRPDAAAPDRADPSLSSPRYGGRTEMTLPGNSAGAVSDITEFPVRPSRPAAQLPGSFEWMDVALPRTSQVDQIGAWTYRPSRFSRDLPMVFVMHGVERNSWSYLRSWSRHAEAEGFVLVVPEFSRRLFPTSREYNLGNVCARDGTPLPQEVWSFGVVEALFEHVRTRFGQSCDRYHIYGHSAGAQFVHRLLLHTGGARIAAAAAANAGWYMVPDRRVPYPYGIADLSIDDTLLASAMATPMTLLLGSLDHDPASENLRRSRPAMAQGPHRLARGHHFIEAAADAALRRGLRLNWTAEVIENVGHKDRAMAHHACRYLLRRPRRPSERGHPNARPAPAALSTHRCRRL